MENADDVVERLAVDREARVRRVEHGRERFLRRHLDRDRDDVGLRDHHVGDVLVPEVEDALDQLALAVLDLALRGRAGEEHPQLGLRMDVALGAGRMEAERVEGPVGRRPQQPDDRAEDDEEAAHRPRDPERRSLRMPERRALRHELAEDDVEEREDPVGEDDRERRRHPLVELLRQRRLAERSDSERGERDAELHRGNEPPRIRRDAQDAARAPVALVLQLDDPRPPRRDEAVLRRHEERVEQDQESDPDQLQRKSHALTGRASVLGRLSSTSRAGVYETSIGRCEHMFATLSRRMRVEYREEPCRNALNRVRGMPFAWSLNPYMGCVHQCTFCYVRSFEARADRPWDDRYGASIRVKTNIADVLRRELARASWERETGRARRRDRSVPAGGGPLPADARVHRGVPRRGEPVLDHHARAAHRARRRRARRSGEPRGSVGDVLRPDARRRDLAAHGAGHCSAAPAAPRAEAARRRGSEGGSRDGADPARA